MHRHLEIQLPVNKTRKLCDCLIELKNADDKELITKNEQKLMNIKNDQVYINHDLSRKIIFKAENTRREERKRKNGKDLV